METRQSLARELYTCDILVEFDSVAAGYKAELRTAEAAMRTTMDAFFDLLPRHVYDEELRSAVTLRMVSGYIQACRHVCSMPLTPGAAACESLRPDVQEKLEEFKASVRRTIAPLLEILPSHLVGGAAVAYAAEIPDRFATAVLPFYMRASQMLDLQETHRSLLLRQKQASAVTMQRKAES